MGLNEVKQKAELWENFKRAKNLYEGVKAKIVNCLAAIDRLEENDIYTAGFETGIKNKITNVKNSLNTIVLSEELDS